MHSTFWTASLLAFLFFLRLAIASMKPKSSRRIIPSPRDTLLPLLSASQIAALPYPPDILPGGRDVDSPYGVMRVYEWGLEEGRKVVMIHGDTTPAPILGPIAKALVARGCRVLVLDLWGRGYSDTPLDLPHDARLFATQILIAITSSSVTWTGISSNGFSMIGFSLGGGISMSFAAYFPNLVNSIILLAPGGIIRSMPHDYETAFFRHPGLVPSSYLRRLVGKILGADLVARQHSGAKAEGTALDQTQIEVAGESKSVGNQDFNMPAVVQWQFDNHRGFIHSFISTIQNGPIQYQHSDWYKVGKIIKGECSGIPGTNLPSGIQNSKVLVIFGETDDIVVGNEVSEDLTQIFGGAEHVAFRIVPGGHGFPVPSCDEVVKHITEFWKLSFEN